MDWSLDAATLTILALAALGVAAVTVLASVLLGVLLVRERRRTDTALGAVFAGQAELRRLLEERVAPSSAAPVAEVAEFVITDAGQDRPDVDERPVSDRVVLSATLGEPLVKAAAFTFGMRRALSAESRNRIRFAMRREVRRSRKQRKQEMRAAWRRMRAEETSPA
jgi:hypothetical protein